MPRKTSVAARLALIGFGILAALAALEVGLQIAAVATDAGTPRATTTWLTGRRRVLCVGDSNTYGLYLRDRGEAYPQQLERVWNASVDAHRIEVLNLGYPGTNSSRLRRDLPRMLSTLRPDVVIIMVGSNDYWTAPAPKPAAGGLLDHASRFVQRHSRLYQLVYMLGRAYDQRQLEVVYPVSIDGGSAGVARYGDVEIPLGFRKASRQSDHDAALTENLGALAELVRDSGATPVFMTYPSRMWNYGDAGRFIREVANSSDTRLVDLAAVFEPVCPQEPCEEWLYKDHHPTAQGYRLIVETLVRELSKEL